MLPLLLCQGLFAALIAFGPTIDHANRVAGLASVAISVVVSSATASSARNREVKLGALALIATVLAVLAVPYTDGAVVRNPAAVAAARLMALGAGKYLLSPHILGLAIGVPALFLTSLALYSEHPFWLRALWLLGATTAVAVVGVSDSRDAAIATVGGFVLISVALVIRRRGRLILLCALAIAAAALGTLLFLGSEPSIRQRGELWVTALRAIADSPALGLGYGGLSAIYRNGVPALETNAHNLFLQTSADFGLIGLVAFILTVLLSIRAAVVDPRVSPALFNGFVASLTFIGMAGMAESMVDMTQRFSLDDVTIVVPLVFVVLAIPFIPGGPHHVAARLRSAELWSRARLRSKLRVRASMRRTWKRSAAW